MKRVWIAGALLVVLAAGGYGYQALVASDARSQTRPNSPGGPPAVPVIVVPVKVQPMPVQFDAVGTVQTIASVSVRSRVDGEISGVFVKDGQAVKAGQVILTIDPRFQQAQLDLAQANLARDHAQQANAFRDVNRYKPLAKQEFVSRQQLDTSTTTAQSASAAVKADEAAVESAQVTLSYFTIKAAIDGRIGYVNQKIGNDIKANDVPLATINQMKPIYVSFPLPQADLPPVRNAMAEGPVKVLATPVGASGKPEQGLLSFFENSIDPFDGNDFGAGDLRQSERSAVARPVLQCHGGSVGSERCSDSAVGGGSSRANRRLRVRDHAGQQSRISHRDGELDDRGYQRDFERTVGRRAHRHRRVAARHQWQPCHDTRYRGRSETG